MNAFKNLASKSFKMFDNFVCSDAHLAFSGGSAVVGANVFFYEEATFKSALYGALSGGVAGISAPVLLVLGLAISPSYAYKQCKNKK